ncbi:hypothetical protein H072_10447 [Dactylellina haptotyla CBS 200.50]|uniref:Uncharacterized protein n=1 Tax=Dactylellina haptotyla (strain CBS 200.50) TaxID=1284197 RepID=S8BL66_DACHA|nr:hypothetical protein H072_10447 [Dactylellina haptotyla CBS 200.50]
MSGFPHGDMGPPGPPPPIPPRPSAFRPQGVQTQYYNQETTESPGWRVPYQETEVLITTVDSTSSPSVGYTETNLSRNASRRHTENYAIDSAYNRNTFSESAEQEIRVPSHNMVADSRGRTETEQVSDGMNEGLYQLGIGGMTFYDTSRPSNWTPISAHESVEQDRNNSGLRTLKSTDQSYENFPIPMDFYEPFTPNFTPASSAPQFEKKPISPAPSYDFDNRQSVPHLSVSDPFPISVDQEQYSVAQANLRESQFPEPVNMGGSDPLWQPPSRSYTSYRRTPRRPNEDNQVKLDNNGLPSLGGLFGPGAGQPQQGRNSFNFDDDKKFYPGGNNYNQSAVSLLSTHSENIPPSSRYGNDIHRTPSYASLRPDIDNRPQVVPAKTYEECEQKNGIPPPPTRYFSQRQAGGNKLGQVLQDRKMDYVVSEINRKDELHRRIQEESRGWGY